MYAKFWFISSERRKDATQSGYGTLHERLGADSIKGFDCCSLVTKPAAF
jgi:nitric oxide synthase-interacting protein